MAHILLAESSPLHWLCKRRPQQLTLTAEEATGRVTSTAQMPRLNTTLQVQIPHVLAPRESSSLYEALFRLLKQLAATYIMVASSC